MHRFPLRCPHDARPRSDRINPHSCCAVFHISRYSARRTPLSFMASRLSSPLRFPPPSFLLPLSGHSPSPTRLSAFPCLFFPLPGYSPFSPASSLPPASSLALTDVPRFFSPACRCSSVSSFLASRLSSHLFFSPVPKLFHAFPARVEFCRTAQQSLLCP